ncbi:MAG: trypsin-like peptidase domain-containing protein [Deltaproteobacteria bacterium]|nr:trypsin-like peptidase domain-containing protein [Deltaproteobacteria bacterium]
MSFKSRLNAFLVGLCLSVTLLAVDAGAASSSDRIIDENDLEKIYAKTGPIVEAIGRMNVGCTVTHLGNGIAITAGHCFVSSPFHGIRSAGSCESRRYDIKWGVTYTQDAGYLGSKCVKVLAIELNQERDYAILRVNPVPPRHLKVEFEHEIAVGDTISIFSHPSMRPLEWSSYCGVEGFFEQSKGNQFRYSCDTEGGSSGASVLNKEEAIVGIHNYYNAELNRNGATKISSTPLRVFLSNL